MRSTLVIAAALAAGLTGLPGGAFAQTGETGASAIEQSPLAPLRPRLPGGTVVTPDTRPTLPPGVAVATPPSPATAGAGAAAPSNSDANGLILPAAPAGDAAAAIPDDAAAGDTPDAAAGAATAALPTDPAQGGETPPAPDLFKRAPPGTGGSGEIQAPQLIDPVARGDAPGAVLRQLDKLTGQIDTFELAAGAEVTVARLRIALTECRLPTDGTTSNHIAFLRVWDTKKADAPPVFSGWMFADSPALSAMDHPRYDLWVIRCTTAAGSESAEKP